MSILCVLTLPNFRNCYTLVVTVAIVLIKVNMIRLNKICLRAYWGNYTRGPYQYKDAALLVYDDVIKWKHLPRYWSFGRGIDRSPVNSPHKGQWSGALMFSLICAWKNGGVNNHKAGDLRCNRAHYDVSVMLWIPIIQDRGSWDYLIFIIEIAILSLYRNGAQFSYLCMSYFSGLSSTLVEILSRGSQLPHLTDMWLALKPFGIPGNEVLLIWLKFKRCMCK